jgi:hypothetical protein
MLKATAIAIMLPCSAIAQTNNCGPHADVVARLAEGYGETRRSIALGANNTVVETFASEAGSWTITVTTPGGPTCLVAAGQAWQAVSEELPAPGEDM